MTKDGARPGPAETVAQRAEPSSSGDGHGPSRAATGVGEVVGSYRLEALLGSGGMGRVYRARHVRLGREVALKLLLPNHAEDRQAVARFFNEAQAVNAIDHEHIVQIYDCVEEPPPSSRVYCILELLQGRTLSQALKEAPIPLARALELVRQICDALAAAHRCGVVHRDVKPANIFLTDRPDGADFVKVLDFGVAKMLKPLGEEREAFATQAGVAIGTPEYMSPEQALSKPVDERSDIYAVGLLLYELLSGRRPFDPGSLAQLLVALVTEPPKALPGRTPQGEAIPPVLADLVMRCLRKSPDERPQTMAEVRATLVSIQKGKGLGPRRDAQVVAVTKPQPAIRPVAKGRRRTWTLAAIGVVLVASGLWALLRPRAAPPVQTSPPPLILSAPIPALKPAPHPAAPSVRPPAPAPTPSPVTVRIASTPSGAEVRRADTGELLGKTPFPLALPAGTRLTLVFHEVGYREARHALVVQEDGVVEQVLSPEPVRHRRHSGSRQEHPLERDAQLDPFASH